MVKCLSKIMELVSGLFVQDESIGLKSIEKIKVTQEICTFKKEADFKFSDIMK